MGPAKYSSDWAVNMEFEWEFHLQGENIWLYNLFSAVRMITWMKLGGNRPPGDNLLSI